MADHARDADFAQFVADERRLLFALAYLMVGSVRRAEDVLQSTLARLYGRWPGRVAARRVALYEILHSSPGQLVLPWRERGGVELLDGPGELPPAGIAADVGALPDEVRRAVLLTHLVGLSLAEAAGLLASDEAAVAALLTQGFGRVIDRQPERSGPGKLTRELEAAVPEQGPGDVAAAADLAHGRLLVRRRQLRRAVLATAAVVALLLGVVRLAPGGEPAVPAVAPTPIQTVSIPTPTPAPRPACDTDEASCRILVLQRWRNQMARITSSYLDPGHHYFSGYTYSSSPLYDSGGVWTRRGGVLGLSLSGVVAGGTEVYLQIATAPKFAVRCGHQTHHSCAPQEFLDGNTFTLTPTIDVAEGMEVQYSPRGDEVITVVARNVARGRQLDVTRAQLMSLVTDQRLRLPAV